MVFKCHFNAILFIPKSNRFVLRRPKLPNHFVLKIRPGGFADYTISNFNIVELLNLYSLLFRVPIEIGRAHV